MESTTSAPNTPKEKAPKQKTNDVSQTDDSSSEVTEVTEVIEVTENNIDILNNEDKAISMTPPEELRVQAQKENREEKDSGDTQHADSNNTTTTKGMERSISLQVNTDDLDDDDTVDDTRTISTPNSSSGFSDNQSEAKLLSPFLYFTHALREERNRSKLCKAVGSCMNEISHIEEIFGKQILKVRK